MALRIDFSVAPVIRHVFARSRGRHSLYPDARARAAAGKATCRSVPAPRPQLHRVVHDGSMPACRRAGWRRITRARHRRARRLAAAPRPCAFNAREARPLPAGGRPPCIALPGSRRPMPPRNRMALFERATQLRIPARARLARPDATLRVAGSARRPLRGSLPPVHGRLLIAHENGSDPFSAARNAC